MRFPPPMSNPTSRSRISNCLHTIVTSRTTCNCYYINSLNETVDKIPRFEHKRVRQYEINKLEESSVYEVTLLFPNDARIKIEIPTNSETFSYGPLEFGFQWSVEEGRKSISFSLDTEFLSWDEFNKRNAK